MSSSGQPTVTRQDIQLVQNLIECCLQLYMNQKEVIDMLSSQAKIEPTFTELVWQKLEDENREFFKAYHVRLMLKNQILLFNRLLEQQVELMQKSCPSGVAPANLSNGSNSSALNQTLSCYMPEHASASVSSADCMFSNGVSSAFVNGRAIRKEGSHISNGGSSILAGSMDASTSMMSNHGSNIGRIVEMNETLVKTETSYSSNSEFAFCNDASLLEARQPIADTSVGSFSSSEFTGQPLVDPMLDMELSSYGLGHIPRNFSFSDLTDDYAQDILENYGRSPFLPHEGNNFQDSPGREFHEEENRRLDTISEGVSYEDFGSD